MLKYHYPVKSAMPLRRRAGVVPGISVLIKSVFYTRFCRIEKNLCMSNTTRELAGR
jgi:hypothetical protein